MKQFLQFTIKTTIIILLLAIALDYIYTTIYLQANNRNKIESVYNSKAKNYDLVILGSSRANNHFVTEMFEQKGLKTFNYGISGGHLFEADLLLKLMIERHYKIKTVILEADLNLSNEHRAESIAANFLPYIHRSEIIKKHFSDEVGFNELYYIPFYRYVKYETRIGVREMLFSLIHKKSKLLAHGGFYALDNNKKGKMKNDISSLKPLKNKYYEDIKRICVANKINFIAVMTPMCENTKGMNYFEKVKKAYPEIHNYENVVTEDKYFSSCGHMNADGAKIFTSRILQDFFSTSQK